MERERRNADFEDEDIFDELQKLQILETKFNYTIF